MTTSRVLIVAILVLLTAPIHVAGLLADTVKSSLDCASAKNADECADILEKLGKNPFDAYGYVGREPVYGGQNEMPAPLCKSGAPSCNPWVRDWSNTSLPPGAIVTDQGAILPPTPQRPFPWNYLYEWQTLIAGLVALVAALFAVFGAEFFARRKERREVHALRVSLAGEIRLYVDLLIRTHHALTVRKEAFRKGLSQERDFRDLVVLSPPVVYPVAADRLGLVTRPRAADVVGLYASIERLNFAARVMSNDPREKVTIANYTALIELIEKACRASLPLLSDLPLDERDADFRTKIGGWALTSSVTPRPEGLR